MLRHLLGFSILFLLSCAPQDQNISSEIAQQDFLNAVAFGKITELNQYSETIDKQLVIRLFQSPIEGLDCFNETHGVCKFQYFVTVSTYDEHPETNIYRLKEKGEIISVVWGATEENDTAMLRLNISNYTQAAIQNNSDLAVEKSSIQLLVTPQGMDETKLSQ